MHDKQYSNVNTIGGLKYKRSPIVNKIEMIKNWITFLKTFSHQTDKRQTFAQSLAPKYREFEKRKFTCLQYLIEDFNIPIGS